MRVGREWKERKKPTIPSLAKTCFCSHDVVIGHSAILKKHDNTAMFTIDVDTESSTVLLCGGNNVEVNR